MQSPSFKIGASADSHLEVTVSARAHPACTDYWDGNWVRANVAIATGAFRGTYEATLRSEELLGFKNQLRPLGGALDGSATFKTMEEWLLIEVAGNGKGHFRAKCVAKDEAGIGAILTFEVLFDQTQLSEIVRGLDAICAAFPVLGGRGG